MCLPAAPPSARLLDCEGLYTLPFMAIACTALEDRAVLISPAACEIMLRGMPQCYSRVACKHFSTLAVCDRLARSHSVFPTNLAIMCVFVC
jgi:hypothetical protein